MAWVAVDYNGEEDIYQFYPERKKTTIFKDDIPTIVEHYYCGTDKYVKLPKGSIYKLINKELTWEDEPVKI